MVWDFEEGSVSCPFKELLETFKIDIGPSLMKKDKNSISLEKGMALIRREAQKGALTLEALLKLLKGDSGVFLIIFLSLPFCQPLQIPGLSTPFGLAIAFIGLRLAFGKSLWLPQKLLHRKIPKKKLLKILSILDWLVRKTHYFIKPRWVDFSTALSIRILNSLLLCLLGLLLALPLPLPFSNIAVAWAILLIGIGMLRQDGVLLLLAYLINVLLIGGFISAGILWKK